MNVINGKDFRRMIIAGANNLQKNKQIIDDLNVFPVPDGDTGSNMSMTLLSIAKELKKCDSERIDEVAKVASSGALRGARGNSGVITSQIFRGISKGFVEKEEVGVLEFADALLLAKESAYKAVMKPKEGTMLTIIRVMSEKAQEIKEKETELEDFLSQVIDYANEVLLQTPDMLPQLKEAGVVDSGGTGLIRIFEGILVGLKSSQEEELYDESKAVSAENAIKTEEILNLYCVEFELNKENASKAKVETLHDFLKNNGDEIILADEEKTLKVHVHTNHPGVLIEKAIELGTFISVKLENLKLQHTSVLDLKKTSSKVEVKENVNEVKNQEKVATKQPKKNIGFIAVCSGEGMSELLYNLKVDYVIAGGQTMNPSTDDFLAAIDQVNADNIIIFPNNKNIIMAAEQSVELCTDKKIHVIKTKAVPESIAAMVNYMGDGSVEDTISDMEDVITGVRTAEITYAVRDTKSGGKTIKKNDIIGILDGEIQVINKTPLAVAKGIVDELMKESPDLLSIYSGEEAKDEDNEKLEEYIAKKYPKVDVEISLGGQPLYYYIISAE